MKIIGTILSLAPNFDNNLALISRGYAKSQERNDLMVKLFLEVIKNVEYKIPQNNVIIFLNMNNFKENSIYIKKNVSRSIKAFAYNFFL